VAKKIARKTTSRIAKARRVRPLSRTDVTRAEYNDVIAVLNDRGENIDELRRELEVQFKRMAQMQSELDEVRRAWTKARRDDDKSEG
jgi:hypothetical protein